MDRDLVHALLVLGICGLCRKTVQIPSVHLCGAMPDETEGLVLFTAYQGEHPGYGVVTWIPKRLAGDCALERIHGKETLLKVKKKGEKDVVFRTPTDQELALRLTLT